MKLLDAYNLLVEDGIADNHRFFAEIYKHYGFTDDRLLKDYLDFIIHEPVLWMKGFPTKLNTKLAIAKPKTAIIKLLKKHAVTQALGADYVGHVHTTVWKAFKQEADAIVAERQEHGEPNQPMDPNEPQFSIQEDVRSVGTVDTVEVLPTPPLRIPPQSNANNDDRVEFLKSLLLKLAEDLPVGAADAFRLLVARV